MSPFRAPRPPHALTGPTATILACVAGILAGFVLLPADQAGAQTLRGGTESLDRQNHQAQAHNFTYLATPADVRRLVEQGHLVPVIPNRDFDLHNVSFPYARPEVRLFIERLASQYHGACGEKLVVTSLTRPQSNQPWNASSRSVHPTGMALDLRRSQRAACRNWLESTLLSLEGQGLLEAIYERNPPHYHVAVYPRPYAQYVSRITGNERIVAQATSDDTRLELDFVNHRVARGETLSRIATRYSVAVSRLRSENNIRGDRILVGQSLRVPVYRQVTTTVAAADAPSAGASSASADLDGGPSSDAAADASSDDGADALRHTVRRGESLWAIAQRHGVTVSDLTRTNGIRGSRIQPGQVLEVPVSR
ncbi:MAG: LysM peptidoglycan-binding domain-containing protein [Gemmatimonadales bacterium]|nr:MAG: LysM peptidoglycan-binding domain-containing protein [Gemmatimonadales bacterium]